MVQDLSFPLPSLLIKSQQCLEQRGKKSSRCRLTVTVCPPCLRQNVDHVRREQSLPLALNTNGGMSFRATWKPPALMLGIQSVMEWMVSSESASWMYFGSRDFQFLLFKKTYYMWVRGTSILFGYLPVFGPSQKSSNCGVIAGWLSCKNISSFALGSV